MGDKTYYLVTRPTHLGESDQKEGGRGSTPGVVEGSSPSDGRKGWWTLGEGLGTRSPT